MQHGQDDQQHDGGPVPIGSATRRRALGRVGRLVVASGAVAGLTVGLVGVAGATSTSTGARPTPSHTGAPPGGGTAPTAAGTVTSVGTGTFTLETRDKTSITVDVTSGTTYRDPKVTSPSFADVTVGERVGVTGTKTSDTVAATSVMIGIPSGPGGKPGSGQGGAPPKGARPPGGGSSGGPPPAA